MNLFSRLQNKSARVLSVGSKPLEDRPFFNLSLQSLLETFEDIQTAGNSFGDWVQQKTHLYKVREKLFLNLDSFFNQPFILYSFSKNSKIKNSPLYQKIKFSKQKVIHSLFQKIDQWMTVGDFKKQVQTFDSSFIELLHSKNFISNPHSVKDIHLYGLSSSTALAFYEEEFNRKTILIDHQYRGNIPIFEGVHQGWKRCFILAHEAGHLEFSNQPRFSFPQLGPNLNEEVQKQIMGLERNPFSLFFEEMTVEAFAAASLLKISQFSTEGVKAVKDFKKARELSIEKEQIRFSEYAKSVNSERSFILHNDVNHLNPQQALNTNLNLKNLNGRIGLENIQKIPHAGCSLGIDLVLNHLDELKNIEPSQIMDWICQKTSETSWNYWTESDHLKEYQVTPGDGLIYWINQKKDDSVGVLKRDLFIRNTILDQLIGLNDEDHLIMRLQKMGIPPDVHDLFRQQNLLILRALEKLPENLLAHQKIIESTDLQKQEHLILKRLKEESIHSSLELIQKHVTFFLNEQQTHPDFMSTYLVNYKEKWNRMEQSFNAWQNEKKDLTAKESSIPELDFSLKYTMTNLEKRRRDVTLKENEPVVSSLKR